MRALCQRICSQQNSLLRRVQMMIRWMSRLIGRREDLGERDSGQLLRSIGSRCAQLREEVFERQGAGVTLGQEVPGPKHVSQGGQDRRVLVARRVNLARLDPG